MYHILLESIDIFIGVMVDSLSEDDFRKALYESLNKKGIVSSFKSHLRQQLAAQLAGKIKVNQIVILYGSVHV